MSDDQFQQITNRLDQIGGRFEKVDKQIGELSDLVMKLYQHTEGELAKVRQEIQSVKADVSRVYDLVDEDLKRRETDEQERAIMNHQLDRHEDWMGRASKQLGVSYER